MELQRFDILLDPECCEDVWSVDPSSDTNVDDGRTRPNVYKPGGQVKGLLQIVVTQPFSFTGIYISVNGHLFVGFNEGESDKIGPHSHAMMLQDRENKDHVAEKDYVILPRQQIFGSGQERAQCFPPGEHQFPFKFIIPGNVPSSYDGSYGFIEYKIDAFIDQTAYGLVGYESHKEIVIHGFYDLSAEPAMLVPVEKSEDKTYCCLCCEDGMFGYSMVLPKRGYTHGERIQAFIVLNNNTPKTAEATLKLDQKVVYEVGSNSITSDKETLAEYFVSVDPQSTHHWNTDLKIKEQLTPSKLAQCTNIKVNYILKLKYEPTGCNCDQVNLDLDLVIGHLPESFIAQSVPVMTEPQTYIYPSVDLSTPQVPGAECQPLLPPPYIKGGNPVGHPVGHPIGPFAQPAAEPTAPPVTQQPYPRPPFGDDRPAPPSYAECLALTDMSGAPGPAAPMSEHYTPYSQPEFASHEEEQKRKL